MRRLITLLLAAIFLLPLTAFADDDDYYEEYSRGVERRSQDTLDHYQRRWDQENMRDAIERRDYQDMEYYQRQMELHELQRQIMGQ